MCGSITRDMQIFDDLSDPKIAQLLANGAVGVIRTDTLYGIVCDAKNEQSVLRIYELKGRDEKKSPIVLVATHDQLFDIPNYMERKVLNNVWPGPVSVVLESSDAPFWIKRSNDSVAYRMPAVEALQELIATTGPLIAPSANPQGCAPATTTEEAADYFGENIDFYVNGGHVTDAQPSQLLRLMESGEVEYLR